MAIQDTVAQLCFAAFYFGGVVVVVLLAYACTGLLLKRLHLPMSNISNESQSWFDVIIGMTQAQGEGGRFTTYFCNDGRGLQGIHLWVYRKNNFSLICNHITNIPYAPTGIHASTSSNLSSAYFTILDCCVFVNLNHRLLILIIIYHWLCYRKRQFILTKAEFISLTKSSPLIDISSLHR